MNILFLVHRIPYPPNKGDKIRSFHEIKYLAREHNLYLAFLVDDEGDLQYLEELRRYCVDLDFALINPRLQKIKSLPYLLTGTALSVPYFYSPKLQGAIDKRLESTAIDAIICFSSPMAEYVFRATGQRAALTVMDFVDVDSDKWRMYAGFSSFPWSAVYRREWKALQAYEKRVGEAFDWSLFVSEKEVELFSSFCPGSNAAPIANGVDSGYYRAADQSRRSGPFQILFVGAMDYFPNEDAVLHFAGDILPLVRRERPDARFLIVGGKPSRKVAALAKSDPAITVTGFVPDVRPYLAKADVFVAPFRIARGVQNKVLEAMAAGVPVVARPEAVQGLRAPDGHLRVASECGAFARAVLECAAAGPARQGAIDAARCYVQQHYDWQRNLHGLDLLLGPAGTR